ncbi:hypothetical protein MIR68_002021 [Amoeboaphelidium protococcarum]|nr:hypothetical protein MIR68_002021 [Amoeboaphelidium protococcarum]
MLGASQQQESPQIERSPAESQGQFQSGNGPNDLNVASSIYHHDDGQVESRLSQPLPQQPTYILNKPPADGQSSSQSSSQSGSNGNNVGNGGIVSSGLVTICSGTPTGSGSVTAQANPSANSPSIGRSKVNLNKNAAFANQFLRDNLEYCESAHIAREYLYDLYTSCCAMNQVQPLNSASFGKTIRVVFPNVATRRLGTRGNSKYHYYGIKEKNDHNPMIATKPPSKKNRGSIGNAALAMKGSSNNSNSHGSNGSGVKQQKSEKKPAANQVLIQRDVPSDEFVKDVLRLPAIDFDKVIFDVDGQVASVFIELYRSHCEYLLKVGLQGRFDQFSATMMDFWRSVSHNYPEVLQSGHMQRLCGEWDAMVYQALLTVFLPDILGQGDQTMLTGLRNFVKHIPAMVMDVAVDSKSSPVLVEKARVATDFSKIVKQYHHLNSLALNVGVIMSQHDLVARMIMVWNSLDFNSISSQALYICPNANEALRMANAEVGRKIVDQSHVSQWAEWIFTMTEHFLPNDHRSFEEYMYIAQQFIIRWSYVSSLIIRDICDKSKELFNSFHMIRLFCDEYVKYLIDCKLDEKRRHFDSLVVAEQWNVSNSLHHHGGHDSVHSFVSGVHPFDAFQNVFDPASHNDFFINTDLAPTPRNQSSQYGNVSYSASTGSLNQLANAVGFQGSMYFDQADQDDHHGLLPPIQSALNTNEHVENENQNATADVRQSAPVEGKVANEEIAVSDEQIVGTNQDNVQN